MFLTQLIKFYCWTLKAQESTKLFFSVTSTFGWGLVRDSWVSKATALKKKVCFGGNKSLTERLFNMLLSCEHLSVAPNQSPDLHLDNYNNLNINSFYFEVCFMYFTLEPVQIVLLSKNWGRLIFSVFNFIVFYRTDISSSSTVLCPEVDKKL